MSEHSDSSSDDEKKRQQIIGLGEKSLRKSYYPQLQKQIEQLNETKIFLEQRTEALIKAMRDLQEERTRAEASERKYRMIVETANEGIWALGPDSRTTFVNSKMTEIIGCPIEEIIGRPFTAFLFEEDLPDNDKRMENLCQGLPQNFERRFLRKDGRTVWGMVSESPIFDDEQHFNGSFAMVTDITEHKRNEEALRVNESKYRMIVETASEGIWIIGSDMMTSFVNRHIPEMTGYSIKELIGKPFTDFMFTQDVPDHLQRMEARRQGVSEYYERRVRHKNGKEIWFHISAAPIFDEKHRFSGTMAMFTDITERKRAEDALWESQRNLKTLNENLENIVTKRTHEVRELSKALTFAEQRERRRMSHLLHEDLLQILLSTNLRISMLIADVKDDPDTALEVSEIKQMIRKAIGTAKTLAVEFNPPVLKSEGLDSALKWLAWHYRKQYGLEVSTFFSESFQEIDVEIRLLLVQFVRELFMNIIKHAKTDKAELSVTRDEYAIKVIVKDEGTGFDVGKARVMAREREYFGLFGIEERLKLISGRLAIKSAPGKGTEVQIILPIKIG